MFESIESFRIFRLKLLHRLKTFEKRFESSERRKTYENACFSSNNLQQILFNKESRLSLNGVKDWIKFIKIDQIAREDEGSKVSHPKNIESIELKLNIFSKLGSTLFSILVGRSPTSWKILSSSLNQNLFYFKIWSIYQTAFYDSIKRIKKHISWIQNGIDRCEKRFLLLLK